jgi:hypothetical protein
VLHAVERPVVRLVAVPHEPQQRREALRDLARVGQRGYPLGELPEARRAVESHRVVDAVPSGAGRVRRWLATFLARPAPPVLHAVAGYVLA